VCSQCRSREVICWWPALENEPIVSGVGSLGALFYALCRAGCAI
jgi:hypothetical protein